MHRDIWYSERAAYKFEINIMILQTEVILSMKLNYNFRNKYCEDVINWIMALMR